MAALTTYDRGLFVYCTFKLRRISDVTLRERHVACTINFLQFLLRCAAIALTDVAEKYLHRQLLTDQPKVQVLIKV